MSRASLTKWFYRPLGSRAFLGGVILLYLAAVLLYLAVSCAGPRLRVNRLGGFSLTLLCPAPATGRPDFVNPPL